MDDASCLLAAPAVRLEALLEAAVTASLDVIDAADAVLDASDRDLAAARATTAICRRRAMRWGTSRRKTCGG